MTRSKCARIGGSLEAAAQAPIRVERGAGEGRVVQMPRIGVDLVDSAPSDLVHFMGLRLQISAENGTEVHDGHCPVRVLAGACFPEERTDESLDPSAHTCLFFELADHGLRG